MGDISPHAADLTEQMNTATRAVDPLIGAIAVPEDGADVEAVVPAASGRALAVVRVRHTPLSSPVALWGPSTNETAQLRIGADATHDDVAEVLDGWLERPAAQVDEVGGDTARSLRLPVTARLAVLPLIERGFVASTMTLARRVTPRDADDAVSPSGLRAATEHDRLAMRALMRELIQTETAFGAVRERAPELSDSYADEAIDFGPGWTSVAEVDGAVVGWASLHPPEHSEWAAPSVSRRPAAYLGVATVTARHRSAGIGRRLAAALHRHAAEAGVDTVLLDASALNPWSTPFWQRQGYRPLWITWQRRMPR